MHLELFPADPLLVRRLHVDLARVASAN
ncbi:putative leader peptide [Saxibacter everestensis]